MKGYAKDLVKDIQSQNETILKNLASQIKAIDKSIRDCLQQDEELQRKAKLIEPIPGIGQQIAAYVLIVSRGMESFATPRQFACYSGCAPFEHIEQVSVAKTKVHFLANRKMKMLLHMAAISNNIQRGIKKILPAKSSRRQKPDECIECGSL